MATLVLAVIGTISFAMGKDDWNRTILEPSADAQYYYTYLPSMVLDRDLDFSNQYKITKNWYRLGTAPTGRPSNVFGIGPAIFQLPVFTIGHGLALLAGSRTDGFSRWETSLVLWTGIPFTLGALLLAARLARRRVGEGAAAYVGPLIAVLAGPAIYYAIRHPGYSHPYAMFFVALLVERWDASYDRGGPRGLRTWLCLGAAFGAAALARPQLALWGILLLHAAIDDLRYRGSTSLRRVFVSWIAAAVVAVVVFLPQLIAWKSIYGEWYVVPQGAGFMRWDSPAWLETLFSSRNGLFPWAPLLFPMIFGLLLVDYRARLLPLLALGLIGQAFVNGAAWDWWGGGSFGGRRFDSAYIVFALGAAALTHRLFGQVRRAVSNGAGPRARIAGAIAAGVLICSALTTVAQVRLARRTSVVSARIAGGEPASAVWRARVGGVSGALAARLSSVVTAPIRATFAIRHDVGLGAYDLLVGVHYLGETYPGLNSYPDKLRDTIKFGTGEEPRTRGLQLVRTGVARMQATRARLFVGLNRRGGVRIRMRADGQGTVRLLWEGKEIGKRTIDGISIIEGEVQRIARGVQWLEIEAPEGTTLYEPELLAQP